MPIAYMPSGKRLQSTKVVLNSYASNYPRVYIPYQ